MSFGLYDYLTMNPLSHVDGSNRLLRVGNYFYAPGFWVALAAYSRANKVPLDGITFFSEAQRSYASAIKLPVALGGEDKYPYERSGEGKTYSGLVLLDSKDVTDNATSQINNCIRTQCQDLNVDGFVKELCEVVGDLHDNVWSHGKETGFSMFQKWGQGPSSDVEFEFALADCGLGFLRELKRVGFSGVSNSSEAIAWCIEEGNSSKLLNEKTDEFSQRLPEDMMGNPMPGLGVIRDTENHHQGLGLAKLIKLVSKYKGTLCLATGDAIFTLSRNGDKLFRAPTFDWSGVSISCRFSTSSLHPADEEVSDDDIVDELLSYLGG